MPDLQEQTPAEMPADAALQQAEPGAQPTEGGEQEETTQVEKVYTEKEVQDRIERATAKAAAKAERRAYREALTLRGQQPPEQRQQVDQRPTRREGEVDDDYLERLADWKLDQREQRQVSEFQQAERHKLGVKVQGIHAETQKLTGLDPDDLMAVAEAMGATLGSAITESETPAKLFAFMASNQQEMERIRALPPQRQLAEIGKLEVRLSTSSPSRAPAPINPITGGRGGASKPLEDMSLSEYEKARAPGGLYARTRR